MAFIYKITNNINGKIYIGKTEHNNPEDRWKEHLCSYTKHKCEKRPLYSAMKKYGPENFTFETIEETENPEEREIYYIDKYRTYVGFKDCNGYNATLGGDGAKRIDLDYDEIINYHTTEAIYRLSETRKHFNVDHDTMKNILKRKNIFWLSGEDNSKMRHYIEKGTIAQIDKDNNIINLFTSTFEANRFLNVTNNSENIGNVLRGYNKTAYGYKWMYVKDIPDNIWNQYKNKD